MCTVNRSFAKSQGPFLLGQVGAQCPQARPHAVRVLPREVARKSDLILSKVWSLRHLFCVGMTVDASAVCRAVGFWMDSKPQALHWLLSCGKSWLRPEPKPEICFYCTIIPSWKATAETGAMRRGPTSQLALLSRSNDASNVYLRARTWNLLQHAGSVF